MIYPEQCQKGKYVNKEMAEIDCMYILCVVYGILLMYKIEGDSWRISWFQKGLLEINVFLLVTTSDWPLTPLQYRLSLFCNNRLERPINMF